MVAMYAQCTFNLNPRPSSIDTPLHAFVPHKQVDHTHPNAAIAVAASRNSERLTREIYGDDVDPHALAAARLRAGAGAPGHRPEEPPGPGRHPRPARPDQLGRRRQRRATPFRWTSSKKPPPILKPATGATTPSEARSTEAWTKPSAAAPSPRSCPGCAARSRSSGALSAPSRTTRRSCASSTATTRRAWRISARAAPTTSCAPRSSRCMSPGTRRPRTRRRSKPNSRRAWNSTARITPPIMKPASSPIRPPCATRTRR